jgi:hypothetical protein
MTNECKHHADDRYNYLLTKGCTLCEIERLHAELDAEKAAHIRTFKTVQSQAAQLAGLRLSHEPGERCLAAGCGKPPVRAAFCEEHNATIPLEDREDMLAVDRLAKRTEATKSGEVSK